MPRKRRGGTPISQRSAFQQRSTHRLEQVAVHDARIAIDPGAELTPETHTQTSAGSVVRVVGCSSTYARSNYVGRLAGLLTGGAVGDCRFIHEARDAPRTHGHHAQSSVPPFVR
jgi:hypothetical protein